MTSSTDVFFFSSVQFWCLLSNLINDCDFYSSIILLSSSSRLLAASPVILKPLLGLFSSFYCSKMLVRSKNPFDSSDCTGFTACNLFKLSCTVLLLDVPIPDDYTPAVVVAIVVRLDCPGDKACFRYYDNCTFGLASPMLSQVNYGCCCVFLFSIAFALLNSL